MFYIINTTYNTNYVAPWATHYGAVAGQDVSSIVSHIFFRVRTALSQLPTNTTFAITNNSGNNFETSNSTVTIAGTAPIQVKTIEVNGVPYPVLWLNTTNWTVTVPLGEGTNLLAIQGIDNYGNPLTNALDAITVTNSGPSALQPVIINEWMADNAGPNGLVSPR